MGNGGETSVTRGLVEIPDVSEEFDMDVLREQYPVTAEYVLFFLKGGCHGSDVTEDTGVGTRDLSKYMGPVIAEIDSGMLEEVEEQLTLLSAQQRELTGLTGEVESLTASSVKAKRDLDGRVRELVANKSVELQQAEDKYWPARVRGGLPSYLGDNTTYGNVSFDSQQLATARKERGLTEGELHCVVDFYIERMSDILPDQLGDEGVRGRLNKAVFDLLGEAGAEAGNHTFEYIVGIYAMQDDVEALIREILPNVDIDAMHGRYVNGIDDQRFSAERQKIEAVYDLKLAEFRAEYENKEDVAVLSRKKAARERLARVIQRERESVDGLILGAVKIYFDGLRQNAETQLVYYNDRARAMGEQMAFMRMLLRGLPTPDETFTE